jgi:ATP-dependent Lon protease
MEVIQLPGYTAEEKQQIARRYLVDRQLASAGLASTQLEITDSALAAIIADYTREAGVRNLEREIGNVVRHAAVRIAEGQAEHVKVDAGDIAAILGPLRFEAEVAMRAGIPGVATGLAWTPVGGDILFIESARMPGNGKLILTGQLGDVMKESAQAALSLVKARATSLGIAPSCSRSRTSTCTCPRARRRRTARARAWRCSRRSPRSSPAAGAQRRRR